MKKISTENAPKAIGPYSQAIACGELVFTSGQIPIDPNSGEVYIADAIDYQQAGRVYRYSALGEKIEEFYVGVIPGAFCWK